MKQFTIQISDETALFYQKVSAQAGRSVEQVLSDSLFKLAGELAFEALRKKAKE